MRRRFAVLSLMMLAIAALSLCLAGCAGPKGQTSDTFKKALEADDIVTNGIASGAYLDESECKIVSYSCSNIKSEQETIWGIKYEAVTADISLKIENDNFVSEAKVKGEYVDPKGTELERFISEPEYDFEVVSSETTPKKGIDNDSSLNLSDLDCPLGDDGKSCTAKSSNEYDFWFAKSTVSAEYDYVFGKNGSYAKDSWQRTTNSPEIRHEVEYKDFSGNYAGKTGSMAGFSKFAISDFDADAGTFKIDYEYTGDIRYENMTATVSGTMTATLDPKKTSAYGSMKDGYIYHFEAKGNSSSGEGQANLSGKFTVVDSGEDAIEISSMSIDYLRPAVNSMVSEFNSKFKADGTLYRQH